MFCSANPRPTLPVLSAGRCCTRQLVPPVARWHQLARYTSQPRMASLTSAQVLDLFRRVGALLEGHFKLSSGLHSPGYLQSALVLQHPAEAEALGATLAEMVRGLRPDVVMSPALGGIVIG